MRNRLPFFRLTTGVALTALLWDATVPLAAVAQPAPPPLPTPYQAQPDQNQADPPVRVGRIAQLSGTVSFREQSETQWTPASLNFPVSSGSAFWTQPAANAQIEVSDSRITLAPTSEFDVATLDSGGLQAVAAQGEAYLHLRNLTAEEAWSVQTPRGLVRLGGDGRYDIIVGSTEAPTLVTVVDGSATIEGPNLSLRLAAGQSATIDGTDNFQGTVGPAARSPFLTSCLDAERPPPALPPRVPADVALMPGGNELAAYGAWAEAPDYGQVWYPQVSPTWTPYREGHWAYVAPWGWTWIDDAPWGFAPFHYGRWVEINHRWAWTPGAAPVTGPPVYAPALVAFVGIGTGVALGAALAYHTIGWVPLGPREPYHPWYHTSDRYIRQMNNAPAANAGNPAVNSFINRGGATAIPAATMTESRPVQATARTLRPPELAAAQRIIAEQPLRPIPATAGVTPGIARQFNLPATGIRPAPGPAVRPAAPFPNTAARPGFVNNGVANPAFAQPDNRPGPPVIVNGPNAARPGFVTNGVANPAFLPPINQPGSPGVRPFDANPRIIEPSRPGEPAVRPDAARQGEERREHELARAQAASRPPIPGAAPLPQVQRFTPPPAAPVPLVQQAPRTLSAPLPSVPFPQVQPAPSAAPMPQVQRASPPIAAPLPQIQRTMPPRAAPMPMAQPALPPRASPPPAGARHLEAR